MTSGPLRGLLRASKQTKHACTYVTMWRTARKCWLDNNSEERLDAPLASCPTPPSPLQEAQGGGAHGGFPPRWKTLVSMVRTLPPPSRLDLHQFSPDRVTATALYEGRTSLSDVAEMNTVTRGPESPPTSPNRAHKSDPSIFDHHVERGTNVVTRSARRCDWEWLSGSRQLASKDSKSAIEEDGLFAI